MKKIDMKTRIPFGPFLGWGIFVTVLFKTYILRLFGL
jgi:prepilin signal peptidase PulO-like enzyme (type II secretory pathway)